MNKNCKHKKEKSQVITTKKLDVIAAKSPSKNVQKEFKIKTK